MNLQKTVPATAPPQPVEAGTGNERLIKSILLVCIILSFLTQIEWARINEFTFDEILTTVISSQHSSSAIWNALNNGADGMPFTFHWLTSQLSGLASDPHIGFRLPSIFGYVAALLGVFAFVSKRCGAGLGLVASLMLTMCPFVTAAKGRPYWLVIGLLALAAACWQRMQKLPCLLGFAFCLTLALAVHHLAIVGLLCFGVAELVVFFLSRKIRWSIWLSIAVAVIPFLVSWPLLQRYKADFAKYFWSKPGWDSVPESYKLLEGIHGTYAEAMVIFICLLAIAALRNRSSTEPSTDAAPDFTLPELALSAMFLLCPAILVALTISQGSGYTERYGAPVLLGFVFCSAWLLRSVAAANIKWLISAFVVAFAIYHEPLLYKLVSGFKPTIRPAPRVLASRADDTKTKFAIYHPSENPALQNTASGAQPSSSDSELPVVMANADEFLPAAYYAAGVVTSKRCYYLADPQAAVQYSGTDTFDKTLLAMRKTNLIPGQIGHVEDLAEFLSTHKKFIVWVSPNPNSSWLPAYLVARGATLRLLQDQEKLKVFMTTLGD